jgi:tetratricopeptide (TPR) repeat protein
VGACYAEGGMPYAPFAQILRRAFRDGAEDNLNLPQFVLADLITLAPALRLRFPDVPLRTSPSMDPQSEQQRLFESMVGFCAALSEQTPVLLVLEDAHWADSGTLSLLRHLARRTRRQRMLLVATYREVELDGTRPFHQVLPDFHRERLVERLRLSRLNREETKELLTALFGEEATPEFLDGIFRETEGNPFFVEEVCKALVESGEVYFADGRWGRPSMEELKIPQSVRVAIQSRVGKLPQAAQETLRLAAVLGREFGFETLVEASAPGGAGGPAGASDQDEDTLVDALESAERAQLIGEVSAEGGGTFAFTHALIPATLVEGLSGLRRRRMHRQVLAAIQRLRPDDWESLAFHALEAGKLQTGLDYSLRAAEKAQRLYALEDALLHYERARKVAASLDLPEQLLTIYEAMGDIQFFRDVPKSILAFEQALDLASDNKRRAAIKFKVGQMYVQVGDERGLEFSEAAVHELDPNKQGSELAGAICAVGRFHHNRGQHRQALTHLERAQRIAEPLDEPSRLAHIYAYLAGAHQQLAEYEKSLEWARRAIALGKRRDHPLAIGFGYLYLAQTTAFMGKWQDALRFAEQNRQFGESSGYLALVCWSEDTFARAFYGLGDLPAAEEAAQRSLDMAEATGESRLAVDAGAQLSIVQADLGQVEVARQNATTAVERALGLKNPFFHGESLGALAHWHMQRGERENAFERFNQAARVLAETDNHFQPLDNGPRYAESCLVVGRLEKAAEVVEKTLALAKEAPSLHTEAVTRRVQAQLLAAQGAWEEAMHVFDKAIVQLEQLGSRLELGRALYHRGKTQAKHRQVDVARASLTRAQEMLQDCSAKIDTERAHAALNSLETGV